MAIGGMPARPQSGPAAVGATAMVQPRAAPAGKETCGNAQFTRELNVLGEKINASEERHWGYTLASMALTAAMAAIAALASSGGGATGQGWVAGAAVGLIVVVDAWT